MKRNAIVRIILFSIAIIILLSILGVGIGFKYFSFDTGLGENYTEISSGTADAASVRNIRIEWVSGTITIRPADVTELTFTETMAEGEPSMVWNQTGDTLKIRFIGDLSFKIAGTILDKNLLIKVPRDWNCNELEVDTASADLNVENLTISKVNFDGASGNFNFVNCTVDTIDIDTASGDMHFSGTLNRLDCDAASADCEIVLYNCPSRIDMDTASGDLDLTLPEGSGFTVEMEALSGDLETDFEISRTDGGFIAGDGACRIDISAMSGDVRIRRAEN